MKQRLEEIKQKTEKILEDNLNLDELNEMKVRILGKKGDLTNILKEMGKVSAEERPLIGQIANKVRDDLNSVFTQKYQEIKSRELKEKLKKETIDVTLPGKDIKKGSIHPVTKTIMDIEEIFIGLGFEIAEGPEIETDFYNFEALNLPKDHPARDMQDSFYITPDVLLRTHTSPVQIRTMLAKKSELPVRIICPGKVYRRDDDATHSPMFHQIEGLVIDKNIRMSDLKGVLLTFAREIFGPDQKIRLRPSFFPFTEPSTEVDIACVICGGKGCRTCKNTGWVEILGAGMVHPNVLRYGGYDPSEVTAFAFGMGVERVAMLKYGINDLRLFYENDVRFLNQF